MKPFIHAIFISGLVLVLSACEQLSSSDPLPSWNEGVQEKGWSIVDMKNDWKVIFHE